MKPTSYEDQCCFTYVYFMDTFKGYVGKLRVKFFKFYIMYLHSHKMSPVS